MFRTLRPQIQHSNSQNNYTPWIHCTTTTPTSTTTRSPNKSCDWRCVYILIHHLEWQQPKLGSRTTVKKNRRNRGREAETKRQRKRDREKDRSEKGRQKKGSPPDRRKKDRDSLWSFVFALMIFCFHSWFFYAINEVEVFPVAEIRRLLSRLLAAASKNIRSKNLSV